jgi:hypothetical protein
MDLAHSTSRAGQANGGEPADPIGVLCGLAVLGYPGIATAVGLAAARTGLTPGELAMRLGLPTEAVVLWANGSFIPRTHHLLRLGELLTQLPQRAPADHHRQPEHPDQHRPSEEHRPR